MKNKVKINDEIIVQRGTVFEQLANQVILTERVSMYVKIFKKKGERRKTKLKVILKYKNMCLNMRQKNASAMREK